MSASQEVIVTSCLNDTTGSAYMYDALNGTLLMTYRGDTPLPACGLSLLAGQYMVAALLNKPFLRVWAVNGQQQTTTRLVCPGRVTHAIVSPDNCYLAATVAEKIHLYQIASGRLVGSGSRHFQPVTVVRWTGDGSQLVCGGEDGLVTVWSLAALAAPHASHEPRFVFSDHSLPVTDLAISRGSRHRVFSVSADRTCKIYELSRGVLLLSLVFDKVLTAVTVSALESEVFVGTDSGSVLQFGLLNPPRQQQYHLTTEECAPVFVGHSAAVRCLSASACGTLLLSGSADCSVKVWHIESRQSLRTFSLKGPITNAFFCGRPAELFNYELQPSVVISDFQPSGSEPADCVAIFSRQTLSRCGFPEPPMFPEHEEASNARVKSLQTEVELLRSINASLYSFAVDKIIKDNSFMHEVSKSEKLERPQKLSRKQKKLKRARSSDSRKRNETLQTEKQSLVLPTVKQNMVLPTDYNNGPSSLHRFTVDEIIKQDSNVPRDIIGEEFVRPQLSKLKKRAENSGTGEKNETIFTKKQNLVLLTGRENLMVSTTNTIRPNKADKKKKNRNRKKNK